jgi:anti-sigma factor RsiW
MKCERMAELLPDYLQRNLNHEQDEQVEAHLEGCAKCREEVALWRDLALIPEEQPSPLLRSRFTAMLEAYQHGQSEESGAGEQRAAWMGWMLGSWLRPAATFAMALALLAVGFFTGRNSSTSETRSPDLTAVQAELANMRQMLVLSMLQQQSASERLQGINWSTQERQADPRVLSALLHALRFDSSVGVRLAALDALSRHSNQPQVRSGLVETLPKQRSPLVQVALIDLLVEQRDTSAVQQLQNIQQDTNANPAVRQRAEWAIQKLNRGSL